MAGAGTRIVIVDHDIVRRGVRAVFEEAGGFDVVAEADDLEQARPLAREHRPAVLVLDVDGAGEAPLEVLRALRREAPDVRVLALTSGTGPSRARAAMAAGASGCVLMHSAARELAEAARRVAAGEPFVSPELADRLASEPGADDLSPREMAVLRQIAHGYTNAEIAGQLLVSVRTIESHRASIQRKLQLSSRAELVRYALGRGLIAA